MEFLKTVVRALLFAAVCSALYGLGLWLKACEGLGLTQRTRDAPVNTFLWATSLVRFHRHH